jgi:hypothetical protein
MRELTGALTTLQSPKTDRLAAAQELNAEAIAGQSQRQ